MGRISYLMVRVDKLPDELREEIINWCLLSFDLRASPVPDLKPELTPFGDQTWLVFHRESPYTKKNSTTPLGIPDTAVVRTNRGEKLGRDLKEDFILIIRVGGDVEPGEPAFVPHAAVTVNGIAHFYIHRLSELGWGQDWNISTAVTSLRMEDDSWCIVSKDESATLEQPESEQGEESITNPLTEEDLKRLEELAEGGTEKP